MSTNFEKLMAAKTDLTKSAYPRRIDGTEGDDFILVFGEAPTFVNALGGDDTISTFGSALHVIYGGFGNDTININGDGPVQAHGQGDDDRINVNTRADHGVFGGDGWDIADFSGIYGDAQFDMGAVFQLDLDKVVNWPLFFSPFEINLDSIEEIYGTSGIDYVVGSDANDVFHSVAGSDWFYGGDGDDTFYASDDGSEAEGGAGDDALYGGGGNDTLNGGSGDDEIHGGDLRDFIRAGAGHDVVYTDDDGDAFDIVYAFDADGERDSGNDQFFGGTRDLLTYEESDVAIYLSTALGVAATRSLYDQSIGVDSFSGFTSFRATDHSDFIRTSNTSMNWDQREFISAGHGNDIVYASSGYDYYNADDVWVTEGEFDSDTVDYSSFFHSIDVNLATERANFSIYVHTLVGFENVIGSNVADTIVGDDYGNKLNGGGGADSLTGGLGDDTFVFARNADGEVGSDVVTDFEAGADKILIDDLMLWDGTLVGAASDLDVDGNGTVDENDGTAFVNSNGTYLVFQEGLILFENVYGIDVDDMLFA